MGRLSHFSGSRRHKAGFENKALPWDLKAFHKFLNYIRHASPVKPSWKNSRQVYPPSREWYIQFDIQNRSLNYYSTGMGRFYWRKIPNSCKVPLKYHQSFTFLYLGSASSFVNLLSLPCLTPRYLHSKLGQQSCLKKCKRLSNEVSFRNVAGSSQIMTRNFKEF